MAPERFVWLGSLGIWRRGGQRTNLTQESCSELVVQALRATSFSESFDYVHGGLFDNHIFGLATIEPVSLLHEMSIVDQSLADQLEFWKDIAGEELDGRAFIFKIKAMILLPETVPVQRLTGRNFRGFVAKLEAGQADDLMSRIPVRPINMEAGARAPSVLVRVTAPHACLLAAGAWNRFLLPHMPAPGGRGTSGIIIQWGLLGYDVEHVPVLPPEVAAVMARRGERQEGGGGEADGDGDFMITADFITEVANLLRGHAVQLQLGGDQFGRVADAVGKLARLQRGLELPAMLRRVRHLDGHHLVPDEHAVYHVSRRTPYRAACLLQTMQLAGVLNNSMSAVDALQTALEMIMPACLLPTFLSPLRNSAGAIPNPGTVSRWRFLLDSAFMVTERNLNAFLQEDCVRYVMADSSMQHSHDFEHIVVCTVPLSNLAALYQIYLDTIELWTYAHTHIYIYIYIHIYIHTNMSFFDVCICQSQSFC